AVVGAACTDGPEALGQLALAEHSVLAPGDYSVVQGLLEMCQRKPVSRRTLMAIWAFATSQLCWQVERDREKLASVREALLAVAKRDALDGVANSMSTLAPAEFASELSSDRGGARTSRPEYASMTPIDATQLAADAAHWDIIPDLLRRAQLQGGTVLQDCISRILPRLRARA